jgi:hypothetical protein
LGTAEPDEGYGVSADGLGNVYLSGTTSGSLAEPDSGTICAFVAKYDAAGTLLWLRQLGSSSGAGSYGVSADAVGNVYISGFTVGDLGGPSAGVQDAFISKYNSTGTLLWSSQIGTGLADYSFGVSTNDLGSVYFSGITRGDLAGPNVGGFNDAFLAKISEPAVPEPATVLLLVFGTAVMCSSVRQFREELQ